MNKNQINALILLVITAGFSAGRVQAANSGGLTLIETPGARSAALAGALTAELDDVTAFSANPATLGSIKNSQASFLYHRGLADDRFGQLLMGGASRKVGWGFGVGAYDAGSMEVNDGASVRQVSAQRDLTASLGLSRTVGAMTLGVTGKYLSSELAGTVSATAFAADLGMTLALSKLRFGASLQNIGTELKYVSEGDPLPRLARAGLSYPIAVRGVAGRFVTDGIYWMNEKEFSPGAGLEFNVGPLAIRGGYRSGSDIEGVSLGAGVLMGRANLDYAFGFVNNLESRHRVSVMMRFGSKAPDASFVKAPAPKSAPIARQNLGSLDRRPETTQVARKRAVRQVYVVRDGDSLGSIARRKYGNTAAWKAIFNANRQVMSSPRDLQVGQRLVLP